MKDSDTTYLIVFVFLLLALAGDLAVAIGNISLAAWLAFELMFCVPCMIPLLMLAIVWDAFEQDPYARSRDESSRVLIVGKKKFIRNGGW